MREEKTICMSQGSIPVWDDYPVETHAIWDGLICNISLPAMYTHEGGSSLNNFRPKELAAEIEADPVIAGTVIAVANSARMGLVTPILTVEKAIMHLGFNLIVSIISSYQLQQALGSNNSVSRQFLDLIRRWSATSRTAALHFFKKSGLDVLHEEASTVALLARLGTVILAMNTDPPHSSYLAIPDESARLAAEQLRWGVSSPVLSGRLVQHWQLPEPIPYLVERLWKPVMQKLDPTEENRYLTLLALSVNIADTYMNYSRLTPDEFLGRNAYRVLADNLDAMNLLTAVNEAWASKLMERELEAASY